MPQKYTLDDVPQMLNSISWHLKCQNENLARIANALEHNQVKESKPDTYKGSILSQVKTAMARGHLTEDDLDI